MLSGYRLMWVAVMFDLPVVAKEERKAATDFRKLLLDLGFESCQAPTKEILRWHRERRCQHEAPSSRSNSGTA